MQWIIKNKFDSSARRILLLLCLCGALGMSGCNSFLDIQDTANDAAVAQTLEDFEQMLNNEALATPNFFLYEMFSDDIYLTDQARSIAMVDRNLRAYLWEQDLFASSEPDPHYRSAYNNLNILNIVIDNVLNASGGTDTRKAIALAEAKIARAYYYFQLVNMFGVSYDAATAQSDLAVPLTLHAAPVASPRRSTIDSVYRQIISDLEDATATAALPDVGTDIIHPGKAAAYGMLARVYLYRGEYEEARNYTDSALAINSQILDYSVYTYNDLTATLSGPITLQQMTQNPEIIYAKVATEVTFPQYRLFMTDGVHGSRSLISLYEEQDYRLRFFPNEGPNGRRYYLILSPFANVFNYSITVPEMMLTKAECLARAGDFSQSIDLVNQLRERRLPADAYRPLAASNQDQALTMVLQERRRELFFRGGLRTFDLKRLNRDDRFAVDLQRMADDNSTVLGSLPRNDPRYLMPFATVVVDNNPNIIQNPR